MYFCKKAEAVSLPGEDGAAGSDYSSTLLLTLTNPTTVLSFLAVLAGLGMAGHRIWWLTFLLVAGIFCGSMLWWVTLVLMVNRFRNRFDQRALRTLNRIAGVAIGFFARKVHSLWLGILFGLAVGFILAFIIAQLQHGYYLQIITPGSLVGVIVGYATQRYGTGPTPAPATR